MADRKLRIGIIGCGGIATHAHIPNLQRNPRAEVVAVADIDRDKAKATAEKFNIGSHYSDFHDLLEQADVDAVCVTTWAGSHAEPAITAAKAGKHIMCEKPIATKLEDADAMVDAADKAGVKFTMGYQHRFGTVWPAVKHLLDEGVIGRVMGMSSIAVGPSAHGVPWFLRKDQAGGGVLMDWGIYTAHSLLWLLGPVKRVYATSAIFRKEVMVRDEMVSDIDVEDTVAATLSFKSGAMGVWYAGWAVAARHGTTSIDGADGSILMRSDTDTGGIGVYTKRFDEPDFLRGWRQVPATEPPLAERHYRKLAHFVDSVLDDTPLILTGADGRDALELILAIYQSADTGQPVDLPMQRGTQAVAAD